MACVENISPMNVDSEMEEGEIVDDLSDISSEEEFLLLQRLQVLENYNNVLERKKAKTPFATPGKKRKKHHKPLNDLSEISATELEGYCSPDSKIKVKKQTKCHQEHKRKKFMPNVIIRNKVHKKKPSRPKKKPAVVVIESSDSDDEYKNKRQKLADAVVVNKTKNDKTSLSERLQKMLCGVNPEPMKSSLIIEQEKIDDPLNCSPISLDTDDHILSEVKVATLETDVPCETIDICTDDEKKAGDPLISLDIVDSVFNKNKEKNYIAQVSDKDSDEDLELLRQHALKTKTKKPSKVQDTKILSDDEDSDTAELRLICLKSALLKKAIEMKRKQKLQKRLSQSSLIDDTFDHVMMPENTNIDNNTDIESVDMDIGSDVDDKAKENQIECVKHNVISEAVAIKQINPVSMVAEQDELEEDEDLLRAKLLTSLSKNLPNLVTPNIIKSLETAKSTSKVVLKPPQIKVTVPTEKRFIINVESDSEGEHEATKNLTKMHMKLSATEQIDFQQKLDIFLKSTRMEVEKTDPPKLPDSGQQQESPKKNEKFVAKAVNHLPKSEQIEYKNLVKRMAELQKIKEARQSSMNLNNKVLVTVKDTLKPRNVTFDPSNLPTTNDTEEKIKISRKNIAEESAKMLKLKDEGNQLFQRFKIVTTELRNLKTALALNKKQQRSVQVYLTKIRLNHQYLLKSSLTSTHSKTNAISHSNHINAKLRKENNPKEKDISKANNEAPIILKAIKYGITNDLRQDLIENKPKPPETQVPRLSVQINVTNNKKAAAISNVTEDTNKSSDILTTEDLLESKRHSSNHAVEKGGGTKDESKIQSSNLVVENGRGTKDDIETCHPKRRDSDDYKSPLDAFGSTTWQEDPNAILCPFEVCGDCKDTDCKYLHTKPHSK